MASSVRPRGYHNTSLLLPDGRILLAGSGRLDGSLMVNETTAEIYSPPYLYKGPRPTITYAPGHDAVRRRRSTSRRPTPRASRRSASSAPASVTHSFNMDQRWQELSFRQVGGQLEIDAPTSANDAPPGVYYVFLSTTTACPRRPRSSASLGRRRTRSRRRRRRTCRRRRRGPRDAELDRVDRQRRRDALRVHRSTTAGFTPSAATRVATVDRHDATTTPGWRRAPTTTA